MMFHLRYTVKMICIGIDEVGRGPLAGPVVVSGFISFMNEKEILALFPKETLRDSKKLNKKWREHIATSLHGLQKEGKVSFIIAERGAAHIDTYGIATSIRECVYEIGDALVSMHNIPKHEITLLLDGGLCGHQSFSQQETIIKGDEKILEISCASIIAKVYRDTYMKLKGGEFPLYGFETHVGYGTALHRDAIRKYGPTTEHRRSFLSKIYLKEEK